MAEDIRELPSPLNPREVQMLSYMMWEYEDYFKSLKLSYMDLWHSGVWINFNKPMKKSVMRGICALSDSLYALIGQDKFQWTKAEDINIKYLDRIESGWSPKCLDRVAQPGEWGVLKLGAVTQCQYLAAENKALPKDKVPRESIEVKKGDLLFTRKNTYDLVAACAYVFKTRPTLMISDTIFRFKLNETAGLKPEYLWALLTHPGKRKQVQTLAGGSAGSMPNISKDRLLKQEIEVPPLELQIRFTNFFYTIRKISLKHKVLLNNSNDCFNSLTQRAFRGEL